MRTPPWLQSLIPRLQSLQSLRSLIPWLSRSLSGLLPPCPRSLGLSPRRRPSPRRPHQSPSEEVGHPEQKQGQASEDGAGRRGRPSTGSRARAASAEPAKPPAEPSAPSQPPAQPAEPVRMTPAQERALRYMQRQDRYMELLARNTHEL